MIDKTSDTCATAEKQYLVSESDLKKIEAVSHERPVYFGHEWMKSHEYSGPHVSETLGELASIGVSIEDLRRCRDEG